MLKDNILKNEEKVAYSLRSLYSDFGYTRYKMSKFEEYDLYVRNKDFLISQGIITFTDTNGKLLALKPDVTLSIIKNSKDLAGSVQKLYYDENVYRTAKDSRSFKEIAQTGLECIGDVDAYYISEVIFLALKSLEAIDENYLMDISHAGLLESVFALCGFDTAVKAKVSMALQSKNSDGINALFRQGEICGRDKELVEVFLTNYSDADSLRARLLSLTDDENVIFNAEEFSRIYSVIESIGLSEKVSIDFSIIDADGYYSGVAFKGYIRGIPTNVLSGGQYDKLMKKMGRNSKAIGFAVYLDSLERHNNTEKQYDCDWVILKDDSTDAAELIIKAQEITDGGESVSVAENAESIKYKKLLDMRKGDKNGNA